MMADYGDQYFTPPKLTRALMARTEFDLMRIAEPCAGDGWISKILEYEGHTVIAGDVDPVCNVEHAGVDMFSAKADALYGGADAVITNPPFSEAARCVRRAMEFAPIVVALLRLSFLEPCESRESSRRADLVLNLTRFIVLPRVSFIRGGRGKDSSTCAWFIWDQRNPGAKYFDVVTDTELAEYAGQVPLFDASKIF